MSADSGRRGGGGGGLGHTRPGQIVSPQPVSDKSIIDSVAGIINDIVPQAYASSGPNSDNRETISWARFEWADINDPSFFPEGCNEGSSIPPLLLVLGYTSGAQLWLVTASGEATEVLSWRSGPVRCLRVLPTPSPRPRRDQQQQQQEDPYRSKRPLVALCDASGPQPHYHAVSFVSLRTGETVRSIRFKSAVSEVLANKRSVLVTFPERIAVFDARTFDDILSVTTCYHSPGASPSNVNPVALGNRWMAYCERRLLPTKRSSGGCEAEGVSSYTATVLYAAKSLGKGLRGLGETVASSLAGGHHHPNSANSGGMHAINSSGGATTPGSAGSEAPQPGIVSVLDLEGPGNGELVAHFAAHSEAVVAMCFDQTGALLMTADRRGHDFHVFRLHPHPGGSSLAAVHHLYVLHRGDTSARVQDMAFSGDARWAVVSTSRGTSHVFPVAPYGGPLGVRTHSSPHVVNRLSRFHRSAGLGDDSAQRSHSPVASAAHCYESCSSSVVSAATGGVNSSSPAGGSSSSPGIGVAVAAASQPYGNPRLPPYPHPTVVHPLAQIRQPSSLGHAAGQQLPGRLQSGRLSRHQSEDSSAVKLCACFAPPRAWICAQRDAATTSKLAKRAVDSLFIMACHGNLIQYDLEPKSSSGVPREKVCDDTPIELEVEAKGQWPLMRTTTSADINVPLSSDSPLLELPLTRSLDNDHDNNESRWLSQVEIFTHAGPHRRLWMGPQFVFKTYNAPSGIAANLVEAETVEVGTASGSRPARSNPVNMPHAASRPLVPVVIDGSGSSYEQSPRFVETYGDALDRYENASGSGENQLREDLADAMLETTTPHRSTGRRLVVERVGGPVAKVVNPLGTVITVSTEEEEAAALALQQQQHQQQSSAALATSTTSSASKSDSVCAEEGKWSGCGCGEELLDAEAVREHTEICAEMRPTPEVAAIDAVPPESIEEVREMRTLCAEFGKSEQTTVVEDCHAWSCPPSSSDEEGAKRVGVSSSENDAGGEEEDDDDGDIEHVLLLGEPEEQIPPQQQQTRRRSEPEDMPDMVEIIDIDAMQRALGEPEPTSESVRVVLAPPKSKSKRNKAQRVKQTPPPPASCESPPEPRWSALLEANKENLQEASEERTPGVVVERSSSSDEANALLLLLPMDTEEENVLPAEVELEKGVEETVPAPLPLLPTSLAASKKANRSKKKKRR